MVLIFRKLYRLTGLVFPLIYFFSDRQTTLFWLSLIAFLFLILEIIRFFFPQFNRKFFNTFKVMLKDEELQGKILGTTYFLLGSLLTVIFFPKDIAIAALLFLVFGDAASAVVGIKWGRVKVGKKTLEGSLAFFIACFLIGLFLKYTYLGLSLRLVFWGSFTATLAELLPAPINDNLIIPLCSALAMTLVVVG